MAPVIQEPVPTAANSVQQVGNADLQFEDSESDEEGQVVAFQPLPLTGSGPQLHRGLKIPTYSGQKQDWPHYKAKLQTYAKNFGWDFTAKQPYNID